MISRFYYRDSNLVYLYANKDIPHYLAKERSVVISSYLYTVQPGDTMYVLAKRIFGDEQEYQWTIISDINFLRQPDDLQPGEVIKLPKIILSELKQTTVDYAKTPSATTKI